MSIKEHNRARVVLTALLLSITTLFASPTQAALDNKGTEFFMAFMPNALCCTTPDQVFVELHLTGDVATMVTVEYPVNSPTFTTTVAVTPGSVTIVSIPSSAAQVWTAGTVENNAVHAFSNNEFVAYMINRAAFTSDAALVLPVDVLNTDYIAAGYANIFQDEFAVTAAFDNTTVTITPTNALTGGFATGVPFNIALNRGQAFLGQSASTGPAGELTGTTVKADKPIAMSNGNECTDVPTDSGACDHVFEVAQPVQTWGKSALAAPLALRPNGTVYRILASADNTTVQQDGATIGTINRGQFIDTGILAGAHLFSADKAIFVVGYMTGFTNPGNTTGDPSEGNVIPTEQYLQAYTFSTAGGDQFTQNFVTIIAQDSDVSGGTILLDGVVVLAADFTTIAGTGFSFASQALTSGSHTTSSTGFHGINVYGYNSADSYLYPGGAKFQFINPVGDPNPPFCSLTPGGSSANGSATDNRPSEDTNNNGVLDPGEDLNGNGQIDTDTGIFFVELNSGSSNLVLTIDPFVPGAGVVNYTVTVADLNPPGTGTITATDGAGNTCSVQVDLPLVDNTPPSPPNAAPVSPNPKLGCTGSACRVVIKCDAVSGTTCNVEVKVFVRASALRLSDDPAAKVRRRLLFASGVANIPAGQTANVRLKLRRAGKQIARTSTRRRIRGVMEIRNSTGAVSSTGIRIRLP